MKIHLLTGLAYCATIEVEGNEHSDLMHLIDDYFEEHGDLPVRLYEMDELDEIELESYLPINGGQFYIEGISHVDF